MVDFHVPTKVIFSAGAVDLVGSELEAAGARRPLVVTDAGVVQAGLLERLDAALQPHGLDPRVFSSVEPDPPVGCVEEGFGAYGSGQCDSLVALGGGSSIDTAKAIGVLASNPGQISDYFGVGKVMRPLPPLVAVPTTCGTGSEVTRSAIITDRQKQLKMVVSSTLLFPRIAVVDPELLVSLPSQLVASTGMDALTHAVEAFTNRNVNPITDSLALGAIRLTGDHLRRASVTGDPEALLQVALASTLAGMAFTHTILAAVHALSHPLGARAGIPHGVANAVLLPHVVRFNAIAVPERSADIARALGERTDRLSARWAADRAFVAVERLCLDLAIPRSLESLGVSPDLIPAMVDDAVRNLNARLNPRRLGRSEATALYEAAFAGI
ncbi:MAG: iron-containing alcohol dehydrogenase [Anaerolineae bacterium]